MESPGSAAAAVCCLCGDRGLSHELFRCNLCRLRLQHRYCSDLYPRVPGPYRSCNWCLVREDGGGGGRSPVEAATVAGAKRRPNGSRDDDDGTRDRGERPWCGGGCSTRSAFSADPGKPVKKPKRGRARAAQRPAATAPKKRVEARFRVKVRRYKLLAEVIG